MTLMASRLVREAKVNAKCRIDISLQLSCLRQLIRVVMDDLQVRIIKLHQILIRLYPLWGDGLG